jgi:glycosyltransferase involved in cell wall biosynthesis
MLGAMAQDYRWSVHCPRGSPDPGLGLPGRLVEYPFPQAERISGIRRLAAPLSLMGRLLAFRRVCRTAAGRMAESSRRALVHNSMVVAAPPVLEYLSIPSLYYCFEYPRHIYEPRLIRRTGSPAARALLLPLRLLERRTDRRSALSASGVVTLSGYMAGRLREIYGLEAAVIRPGVDAGRLTPGDGSTGDYVLSVGALWPFKGHGLAMEAVARLPRRIRPSLRIVADRELPGYSRRLSRDAARLEVDLRIDLGIPEDDLLQAYRRARAVLCCQAREPYGLVPLEAMACARPVVAVAEGGFVDNVEHGRTGLLSQRRPTEVARHLETLLAEPALARGLGEAGRSFVLAERTVHRAAERLSVLLAGTG